MFGLKFYFNTLRTVLTSSFPIRYIPVNLSAPPMKRKNVPSPLPFPLLLSPSPSPLPLGPTLSTERAREILKELGIDKSAALQKNTDAIEAKPLEKADVEKLTEKIRRL